MTPRPINRLLDRLLGVPGEPPVCKVFSADVAIHWYPTGAQPGDACLCGQTVMRPKED